MSNSSKTLALGATLSLGLAGCSLLFDVDPAAESSIDAGQDPVDIANCGPPLSDTQALFHVDGDNFTESVPDFLGGTPGDAVTVTFPKPGVLALTPRPLETRAGPGQCGAAVLLTDRNRPFVSLNYDIVEDVRSFDFWFLTNGANNAKGRGALLTKDGSGSTLGDLGLFVVRTAAASEEHHVMLRLQDAQSNDYFLCSGAIVLGEWHHVAVSFNEDDGVELFVNGVFVNDDTLDLSDAFSNSTCGLETGAQTATLAYNSRNWLWGASNSSSPATVADDVMMGAVDELRFRSVPTTADDANSVYSTQRQ